MRVKQDRKLTDGKEYIVTMPADEGIKYATQMVTGQWIASLSGISQTIICMGSNHYETYPGSTFYYSEDQVNKLNIAIHKIGTILLTINVRQKPILESEESICYGENVAEQMCVLRKFIVSTFIFETRMGKNKHWRDNRMSRFNKAYNHFDDKNIALINSTIHEIALRMLGLTLEYQGKIDRRSKSEIIK